MSSSYVLLKLKKELSSALRRGSPWVFQDALKEADLPKGVGFSPAILDDKKGQDRIAYGFYDSSSKITFRSCYLFNDMIPNEQTTNSEIKKFWSTIAKNRFKSAVEWRRNYFANTKTTGYRLINGEGDYFPGLVIDLYDNVNI